MKGYRFRCSSLGKLMTEPKTKAEGILSVGAKTYIRELAREEIFGVEVTVSSKYMEKGNLVEGDAIALYNEVTGTDLEKNAERKTDEFITGEADLVIPGVRGIDMKSSWSIATFPISEADCKDTGYLWQMRGYMRLWDVPSWEVAYALVDTPEELIGYEPVQLHIVSHIPAHVRLTRWVIERDAEQEAKIEEKVKAAREYMAEVFSEFERTHSAFEVAG